MVIFHSYVKLPEGNSPFWESRFEAPNVVFPKALPVASQLQAPAP
jgi:hypothetical protein